MSAGQGGVAQGVPEVDAAGPAPLARAVSTYGWPRLCRRRPREHLRDERGRRHRERHRGEHDRGEPLVADRGEDRVREREPLHEHQAEPERRDGHAERGQAEQGVRQSAAAHQRRHDRQTAAEQRARARTRRRRWPPWAGSPRRSGRVTGRCRTTDVPRSPRSSGAEPRHVLDRQRLVEPVLRPQRVELLGRTRRTTRCRTSARPGRPAARRARRTRPCRRPRAPGAPARGGRRCSGSCRGPGVGAHRSSSLCRLCACTAGAVPGSHLEHPVTRRVAARPARACRRGSRPRRR